MQISYYESSVLHDFINVMLLIAIKWLPLLLVLVWYFSVQLLNIAMPYAIKTVIVWHNIQATYTCSYVVRILIV